ncbi:MAG: hypothetical protein QOC56_1022 [Alphaproteobacteria bacterium]|nr:hypothetical protein [Alphaproteobacteria bacterium]
MADPMQSAGALRSPPPPDDLLAGAQLLEVAWADVAVALLAFLSSLAVLGSGMSGIVSLAIAGLLHLGVLAGLGAFLAIRVRRGGELTIPVLLLVATFASGPVGAAGCALMALALRRRRPAAARLKGWYDYIAGVVERPQVTQIYDELVSGRLPPDAGASVPRFTPILTGASLEERQRILGVLGRRYHGDFRPVLKRALRNRNVMIRTQAAAIASRLGLEEKTQLWSSDAVDLASRSPMTSSD